MSNFLINNLSELQEAVKTLSEHARLSCDTETKGPPAVGGLFPFHGSRSFSFIFATAEDEYYINFNTGGINPKYKTLLQPIFDDAERIIFFVNASFDGCIAHFDGIEIKCRIVDCPSIARIEFNCHDGGRYVQDESFLSLEYLAQYYNISEQKDDRVKKYIIEHGLYYDERCKFTGKKLPRYDLVPLDIMFLYGCSDARATYDLGIKIIQCINHKDNLYKREAKLIHKAQNEIKLTSVLLDMKIKGAKTDVKYINKAIKHEQKQSLRLHKEIDDLTGGINLNSGKQVAEYLVSQGIDVPRNKPTAHALKMAKKWQDKISALKTDLQIKNAWEKIDHYKAGNYITDAKTLEKLMKKYPELDFLQKITDAKQADKKLNTYYLNFLKFKDVDDIIHADINQETAITGRFSIKNPALQTLHKEKLAEYMIRKSIISKNPEEFDLFFFDYKGQEMYIMIDLAEDIPVIEDIKENGTDIYIAMCNIVKLVTAIILSRDDGKALSLGVAYGQGKALIASKLKTTMAKAAEAKSAFLTGLKGVARLSKKMMKQAERERKIFNPYGRCSYILDKRLAYKALNSLIQGTAADCTKKAMVDVFEFLKPFKSHMILTVHDEIIFEIHKEERHLIPDISRLMSEAYPHKHLPLKVDVEFSSKSWGEKELYPR